MSKKIVMYRTASCPFCIRAEQLLDEKGVAFEQVYLDDHPDRRGFTSELKPGHRTVPLVVVDGEAIGGLDELAALERAGKLDETLGVGGG